MTLLEAASALWKRRLFVSPDAAGAAFQLSPGITFIIMDHIIYNVQYLERVSVFFENHYIAFMSIKVYIIIDKDHYYERYGNAVRI